MRQGTRRSKPSLTRCSAGRAPSMPSAVWEGTSSPSLLPETASAEAAAMGHRLRTTLHRMPSAVPLTLSFGVATWLGGKDTATATLRRADDAMYEAKRLGGDRLVVWQQMRPGLPAVWPSPVDLGRPRW